MARIKSRSTLYIAGSVFSVGIMITLLNIYELRSVKYNMEFDQIKQAKSINDVANVKEYIKQTHLDNNRLNKPIAWIRSQNDWQGDYLKHVRVVLERLGYWNIGEGDQWHLLWAHEYPFGNNMPSLNSLKPYQRVNHFPGTGYITNKVNLATTQYSFVPRAYRLPKETQNFVEYSKLHPKTLWVQKSNTHRGIKIVPVDQLDLKKSGSFIQEFVQHPFLIDGRKFDIGIYTVITSINPLRVYVVDGDALFRFCPHDYYPFDARDVDKYVVGDDYTPMWQIPSLKATNTEMSYSFKQTFNAYLRQNGHNDTQLWRGLYDAVVKVCCDKEGKLIGSASAFASTRNFFEMMRFDFVLDSNLKIYLMEVNMSPNLSSGHFPPNKRLYEHVMYNTLGLVGIGKKVTKTFMASNDDEMDMLASDQDIQVLFHTCMSECNNNCRHHQCKLCAKCMTISTRTDLKLAYMEHQNRGSCARVYPPPMTQADARDWLKRDRSKSRSDVNGWMNLWFVAKCVDDVTWCT